LHFYNRDELEELIRLVRPQHFLPVHGEYAFLCAHAQVARESGIKHTSVIRNGQMLGVQQLRNKNSVGGVQGVMGAGGMKTLGEVPLNLFYNDGNKVSRGGDPQGDRMSNDIRDSQHFCGSSKRQGGGEVGGGETLQPRLQ